MIFYCDSSLKTKNASEIIYPGCPKFKPTQCSCVLVGCMILMFCKFLNSQCFYHTRRCPKNWPPLYTFKSSIGGSQTMQPFRCCIIEQITSKKCTNSFVFRSKDGVRCHATPDSLSSHTCSLYVVTKREWSKRANPPYMTLFPWKLFSIYSWFCVILRGYSVLF